MADLRTGSVCFFSPLDVAPTCGARQRLLSVVVVSGAHIALIASLGYLAARPEVMEPVKAMAVRMFEDRPAKVPAPPVPEQKPLPIPPVKRTPPPILAAAPKAETAAPVTFAVAPEPEPTPAPATAAPSSAVGQVTAARFDADYLKNPKPVYPNASRRLGEEGRVVLRVRVSADGLPLSVDIKQSSGFARLDDAARSAVEQWRFVPAKHGADAIESTVLVPLNFALHNS